MIQFPSSSLIQIENTKLVYHSHIMSSENPMLLIRRPSPVTASAGCEQRELYPQPSLFFGAVAECHDIT